MTEKQKRGGTRVGAGPPTKDPSGKGIRVVAYFAPAVMADLDMVADHLGLTKSEVIVQSIKITAAKIYAENPEKLVL